MVCIKVILDTCCTVFCHIFSSQTQPIVQIADWLYDYSEDKVDILCDNWGNLGLLWLRKRSGTSPKEKAGDSIPQIPRLHIKVPLGKILNPKLPQIASDGCSIALDSAVSLLMSGLRLAPRIAISVWICV